MSYNAYIHNVWVNSTYNRAHYGFWVMMINWQLTFDDYLVLSEMPLSRFCATDNRQTWTLRSYIGFNGCEPIRYSYIFTYFITQCIYRPRTLHVYGFKIYITSHDSCARVCCALFWEVLGEILKYLSLIARGFLHWPWTNHLHICKYIILGMCKICR